MADPTRFKVNYLNGQSEEFPMNFKYRAGGKISEGSPAITYSPDHLAELVSQGVPIEVTRSRIDADVVRMIPIQSIKDIEYLYQK